VPPANVVFSIRRSVRGRLKVLVFATAVSLGLSLEACSSSSGRDASRGKAEEPAGERSQQAQAPVSSPEVHPFFIRERANQDAIKHAISQIQIGETRAGIIAKLGPPTYDRVLAGKKRDDIRGREVMYCFLRIDIDRVDTRDRFVALYFDRNDRLQMIYSNIEGIESRNFPGGWRSPP